mgnify:CR=1 FL=1
MNRCVQFEAAVVFHGAVPTCVPRTAATVAPCVADVDRVHEGGLCGDIRHRVCVIRVLTSLSLSSEEVMMDDKEWVVLMNVKHVMREKHGQSESCESESTSSFIVPYCWLVALSMQSLKFVLLPSAAAVPPTLPRPFLSGQTRRHHAVREDAPSPVLRTVLAQRDGAHRAK